MVVFVVTRNIEERIARAERSAAVRCEWERIETSRSATMALALKLEPPLALLQFNLESLLHALMQPTVNTEHMLGICASSSADMKFILIKYIDSCRALHGDKPAPNIVHVDLDELVQDTLGVLKAYPKAVDITFVNGADADVIETFSCDQNWLMCILINLLTNACDATQEGCIILTVRNDATTVSFDVSDTGVGVHEHDRERLFAPFSK